jgi:hypothetical protein
MSDITIFILGCFVFGLALAGSIVSVISGSEKRN